MQRKYFFSFGFAGLALVAGLFLANRPGPANPVKNNEICCKKTMQCTEGSESNKSDLESLSPQFPGSFLLSIKAVF